ncbi:zonular occludens toxin domain-containing protein [Pseudomonas nitroreducens]|uniref:zonular occludens toxin domain-containing protein n=1 Tax=Pseudomonas nitroreducens TaxID=46680 RepID=UPI00147DD5D4|nr:zonular occludens toxin domain-containing protein [Pseudomonas nitroreducens]NNN24667.1 hypothetical protein [Pseudomonas nitroreducens]NNN24679.1 hypothetical protein [Pseudomonas nitroreducens]
MAITAYVGKPRSGKSFSVVKHVIIPSLKQGRHVVTNIPLQVDMLLGDFGGFITQLPKDWYSRDDLMTFIPPGCVLVLDEVWRRWPAGLRQNAARLEDRELLAEHGHRVDDKGNSMRVILVTQDLNQIASFAKTLVDETFRVVKLTKGTYRVDIYEGSVEGERPPKSLLKRQAYGKISKDIYVYYSSATQSVTGDIGDESKADDRGNKFKSPMLIAVLLGTVYLGYSGITGIFSFFDKQAPAKPENAELVNPPPATLERKVVQAVQDRQRGGDPVRSGDSREWSVGGWLGCTVPTEDGSVRPCGASVSGSGTISRTSSVILVSGNGARRIVSMSSCRWIDRDRYVECDVDGLRVTPWTGGQRSGASSPARAVDSAAVSERSGLTTAAATAPHVQAQRVDRQPMAVTVVPDTEYPSRPWR